MPAIAFGTIKGGVGKTTLAVHVASALADAGRKVLFLDLDPQAHGSMVLGLEAGDRPCIGDALGPKARLKLADVVVASVKRPNLSIAPASLRMAAMERDLYQWGHRLHALPRALSTLGWEPEVVVIDTPPSVGAYTEAAMMFAEVMVAPVPTGAFALQGLTELEAAWRQVRETGGQLVVAVNQYDRRTPATNEAMEAALRDLSVPVLKARVPRSESINQAGLAYEVVFDTSKSALGVAELRALTAELARLVGLPRLKSVRAA